MNTALNLSLTAPRPREQRAAARQEVGITGRVVWKDVRGTTRFNSVVIRNLSDTGAYVENLSGSPIPLYRLVSLQVERVQPADSLPPCLRQGKVLSAVYRLGTVRTATGTPEGYGLRLLIEPRRRSAAACAPRVAALLMAEATA